MLKCSAALAHRQLNAAAKPATNTRKRMDSVIHGKRSGASRNFHRDALSRPARATASIGALAISVSRTAYLDSPSTHAPKCANCVRLPWRRLWESGPPTDHNNDPFGSENDKRGCFPKTQSNFSSKSSFHSVSIVCSPIAISVLREPLEFIAAHAAHRRTTII